MEPIIKKCSSKKHLDVNAVCFCQECRLYMCQKCHQFHSESYDHHLINLDNLIKDDYNFFNGICQEKDHIGKLEFYCRDHNILCCAECIIKHKKEGYG